MKAPGPKWSQRTNRIIDRDIFQGIGIFGDSIIHTMTMGGQQVQDKTPFAQLMFCRDNTKGADVKMRDWRGINGGVSATRRAETSLARCLSTTSGCSAAERMLV